MGEAHSLNTAALRILSVTSYYDDHKTISHHEHKQHRYCGILLNFFFAYIKRKGKDNCVLR